MFFACQLKCQVEIDATEHSARQTMNQLRRLVEREHALIHAKRGDFSLADIKHAYVQSNKSNQRCAFRLARRDRMIIPCNRHQLEHIL